MKRELGLAGIVVKPGNIVTQGLVGDMGWRWPQSDLQWRFEVAADVAALAEEWRAFERTALGSGYHTHAVMSVWCRTAAARFGETPLILKIYDADGLAVLLPLAVRRVMALEVATWLGQAHLGYGFGLFRPDIAGSIDAETLKAAFSALRTVCPGLSAVLLEGQPAELKGIACPLGRLPSTTFHVPTQIIDLPSDFDALVAEAFGRKAQSQHRRKRRHLEEAGAEIVIATTAREREEIYDSFLAQKSHQLAEGGQSNIFADPAISAFQREIARLDEAGIATTYAAIRRNGEIVATNFGFRFGERYHLVQLSMAAADLARASPGHLLMSEVVRLQIAEGARVFDFGPGIGRHKSDWGCRADARQCMYLALDRSGWPLVLARAGTSMARDAANKYSALRRLAGDLRGLTAGNAGVEKGTGSP